MVMSEETRATLREAFNFIDLDKSGYINFDELKRFIELTGEIVTEEHVKNMVTDLIIVYRNYSYFFSIVDPS